MRFLRVLLWTMVVAGVVTIMVGPCLVFDNEGFGDAPGPIRKRAQYLRLTRILMPLGAMVAIASGIAIVIVDRRSEKARECENMKPQMNADEHR